MLYHKGKRLKQWREYQNVYSFIKNDSQRSMSAFLLDEVGYKLERFLIRGDRFGMMSSVELRNPFLYTPLVKFALNTPINFKITKYMKEGGKRFMRPDKKENKKITEMRSY